jgi:ribosomal protein S27E
VIHVRVRDGRPRFLVNGSGGAVYVVDPNGWGCSCPDAHRRGKGCKHSLACWALWRASARPANRVAVGGAAVGLMVAESAAGGADGASCRPDEARGTYEKRECPSCFEGQVYDDQAGSWVACGGCFGTGRARVFVYPKARRLRGYTHSDDEPTYSNIRADL